MFTVKVDYTQLAFDVARSVDGSMESYIADDGIIMVDVLKGGETITYSLDSYDIENWLMTNLVPNITARHYAYA